MRGKSPNWLLGVLSPTTYILGGEFDDVICWKRNIDGVEGGSLAGA